jgi:hypothetical protein
MKLKDILAVSGKPGLYKFLSQARNGIIVESISDQKRMMVLSSTKVSSLADIAIYTASEEVPLKDIFRKIYDKESGKVTISHKSDDKELKKIMEEILPEYDKSRVYVSDIKKLINWYNLLIEQNLFDPNEKDDEEATSESADASEKVAEEKSAKTIKSGNKTKQPSKTPKRPEGKSATQSKTAGGKSKGGSASKKPSV